MKIGKKIPNNVMKNSNQITKKKRIKKTKQSPCVLWFTGLSGSGKSTIANLVEEKLFLNGNFTYLLDGDNIRLGLNKDLGFDAKSRTENIRRIGEVAKLFLDSGLIVLVAFISPFADDRKMVKNLVEANEFLEIFIDTSFDICEKRDIKGLYKKAREGKIKDFTGIDSPYEEPISPHIHVKNDNLTAQEGSEQIISYLFKNHYIKKSQIDR